MAKAKCRAALKCDISCIIKVRTYAGRSVHPPQHLEGDSAFCFEASKKWKVYEVTKVQNGCRAYIPHGNA